MTRHLDFETSLAGLEIRYEGISEIEDSIEGARTIYSGGSRYGGRIGVGWRHSEDIVSQYFVSYDRITEDPRERVDDNGESVAVPGSERDVHGIGASVTLPTGRGGGLLYIEGGLARVGADELRPESEQTRTTFGEIRWRKQYRRGAAFEVGYVHRIGSSFGTGGGNVVRAAYVSYDQPFGPRFSGRVAGGYADRTGIEESIESRDRQTLRLNAELVRSIGERVGITLGYRRLWQESPRIDQQVAYNVYRLGIRWYPRGRK